MTAEEELQGGIRNALEKGIPMEKIMQSFLNAGYPESAVRGAARAVSEGVPVIVTSTNKAVETSTKRAELSAQSSPLANLPGLPTQKLEVPSPSPAPQTPQFVTPLPVSSPAPQESGVGKMKIYFLVGILILLLILLGGSLLFREQLTAMFS